MVYEPPSGDNANLTIRPFTPRQPTSMDLYVDDAGDGVIAGRVTDSNGNPVSGAVVEAIDQNELVADRTTTDAVGEYRLYYSNGGDFHVSARYDTGSDIQSSVSLPSLTVPTFDIPDASMFSSPIYQWTALSGLAASDGEIADNWTERLAGLGDASAVNAPTYRDDQVGRAAVEYDGTSDGHNWSSNSQIPTGGDPISIAATIYISDINTRGNVIWYGDTVNEGGYHIVTNLFGNGDIGWDIWQGSSTTWSAPEGQWITVGGSYAGGSSANIIMYGNGTQQDSTTGTVQANDQDHSIGYNRTSNAYHFGGYVYDIVVSDTEETSQAFSDYHKARI